MDWLKEVNSSQETFRGVVPVPKHITFNKEQEEVKTNLIDFLESDKEYFCLTGKGGVGKTTVIAGALKGYKNIMGITISHKAKEILCNSIKDCFTFASACGMKVIKNELGEKEFVLDKYSERQHIKKADIIVIDECSMISTKAIKIVNDLKKSSAKVIYMGDFRQLPPIDEGGRDSQTFRIPNRANLTVRIRQGDNNPITELADVIGKEIEDETYNPFVIYDHLKTNVNTDSGKGYTYVDDSNFIDSFVKDFKKDDSTKFICFRRATVAIYNRKIRETIYKDQKGVFIKGELVIANDTFMMAGETLIKNSLEYYVESYREAAVKGFKCYMISLRGVSREIPVLTKDGKISWGKELKHLSSKRLWKKFWPLKEAFAEIDYGYAINSHKSQGSTYKNVYMDFNDVLNIGKITSKEKCQSLNVIITRASHNLYLLDI
jgi:exodeoxyribonuclease-5